MIHHRDDPNVIVIFKCCVCGQGMFERPAAFNAATGEEYCADHVPDPFRINLDIIPDGGKTKG